MLRLWQGPLKAPFRVLLHGEHASLTTLGRRGDGVDLGILVPVHRCPKVNTQANARSRARARTHHMYIICSVCAVHSSVLDLLPRRARSLVGLAFCAASAVLQLLLVVSVAHFSVSVAARAAPDPAGESVAQFNLHWQRGPGRIAGRVLVSYAPVPSAPPDGQLE